MTTVQMNPNNSGTLTLTPPAGGSAVDVSCQVTDWQILPTQNTTTRPGTYCSPPTNVPGRSSWGLQFAFLQDWTDPAGISQFTFDNDGELCTFSFVPDVEDAPTVSGSVWVTATGFGGQPAEAWASSGTWPIEGTPTVTPAVP